MTLNPCRMDVPRLGYLVQMSHPVVVMDELTKSFSADAGVFELTIELPPGRIIGFIGPSGSGKTTTIRLMNGLLRPDSGRVLVLGQRPLDFGPDTRARIGYMPQEALLYPDLTLTENLEFAASLYGLSRRHRDEKDRWIELLELEGAVDRLPVQASGGERRRLMLAATLMHQPEVLFLDEPTGGIDPVLRRTVWDRFVELGDSGRSLFVTTQYVGEAAYCDYVAVLAHGRILAYDTPVGLRRSAYGGELIDVVFASRPDGERVRSLERAIGGSQFRWLDGRSVRLIVDDAGEAGPKINQWGHERDVELLEIETHIPPFDDVFVELVQRKTDGEGPSQPERRADTMPVLQGVTTRTGKRFGR